MKLLAWVIALELLRIAIVLIILGHGKIQQEVSGEFPPVMGTTGPPGFFVAPARLPQSFDRLPA